MKKNYVYEQIDWIHDHFNKSSKLVAMKTYHIFTESRLIASKPMMRNRKERESE